jgi:dienelactone hydrolase
VNVLPSTSPLGALVAIMLAFASGLAGPDSKPRRARPARPPVRSARVALAAPAPEHEPFAVGIRTITFIDSSRTVTFPGHKPEPRPLVTVIRYPAVGPASRVDVPGATPARSAGRFPLVIFGHGFAVTPGLYAPLLQAWARAGYVVAAPIFPLGNQNAPGGPNESDIVNQPRDMSFVISQMLALNRQRYGLFSHLIAGTEVAVSGQSDGGETALATAYDRYYLDRRVRAAVILSGAQIPGGMYFSSASPPLLASQGTADTTNLPIHTYQFFDAAPRPKFLLRLLGAGHLPPYTDEQPQLGIVERVTIAFFDRYLKHGHGDLRAMARAGNVPGIASLQADP